MKKRFYLLISAWICCTPLAIHAQQSKPITSPENLYREARELFIGKNYAASLPLLRQYINHPQTRHPQEAEYMLVCTAYELQEKNAAGLLQSYLDRYPDTPHANRLYGLIASCAFFEADYDRALALFNACEPELLSNEERDDMVYRRAISYLQTGNAREAAIWFETLRYSSRKYEKDAMYYVAYIRYTQQRYDDALQGFLPLQSDAKYGALVPYYIADSYLRKGHNDKAEIVAEGYLSSYPDHTYTSEMYRVLGEATYRMGQSHKVIPALENYLSRTASPTREAHYMLGMSYYQTGVYSKAADALGQATLIHNDALAQNAYLHLGLSYLQLADKSKARMAFEQAAASDADTQIREQAFYNYALTLHETSYSAFGESVTAFERFLNEFPQSHHADEVSDYLIEVYMNTRSYDAALRSIERISRPGSRILEAKQKILFHLGTQAFANASFREAADYFNRSLELGSYNLQTRADSYYWRGESYYRMDRMTDAERDFREYLRQSAQTGSEMYALAHYNLGYTAFRQKNYTQARNWFLRYAELDKGRNPSALADTYNRVGDSYLHTRSFEEAKRYYILAENTHEGSGDYAFYQLGLVAGLQKDYAGKVTLLNRLIGKYPSSPYVVSALYEKGRSYVLMENTQQAVTAFRELLNSYPESPLSRKAAAEIGLLYYQAGRYNEATEAYRQVIQKYPGSEEARLALRDLKSIYVDTNRIDEFAALAATLPGDVRFDASEQDSLTYVAAERAYARGQAGEAKESFLRYLQSYPDGAFGLNARYYLTRIGKEQNDNDLVLQQSEKLLDYPDNPFAMEGIVLRAEVQYQRQQFADALTTYKLIREKADNPERRLMAQTGVLRTAYLTDNDTETIHAATDLLADSKLSPELINEATYYRAKAYLNEQAIQAAQTDLRQLAQDTRHVYGAEARYLLAQLLYDAGDYATAESELLRYIDQSTPHAYWLARGFILLSDVYVALDRRLDARQYLLSLQQNYQADDNISGMIELRLRKLND